MIYSVKKRGRLNGEIRGLVEQTNSALLNENANKDSKVIPTQRDLLAGIVAKHYARQHLLPRDVVGRTSVVIFTITISTTLRSSQCLTAC